MGKRIKITGWAVFWLFVIVFFLVDTQLFTRGYNTFFWQYKTKNEVEYQRKLLNLGRETHGREETTRRLGQW